MDAREGVVPSKYVLTLVKTNLLGSARKMTRRKKRPCQNRQLLSDAWSISEGRRRRMRRYISAR